MKTTGNQGWRLVVAGLGLLWWSLGQGYAQGVPETEARGGDTHIRQLTAERGALLDMLNDGNTPAERKPSIQHLLEWNQRGLTIAEVKKMNMVVPAAPPAASAHTLAEAEAAPLPANVAVGGSAVLQNFSKGRDAEASAKAMSSLGLVKVQQEMDNAARESEAKLREAQNLRNQAGASALAQRQQDAASAASQQAAGGMGAVLGDSLVQSVQQGAQAAGQAIGGGAAGRMRGVAGSAPGSGGSIGSGAGDATAGASAAAGQIFGGGGAAPAATPAVGAPPVDAPAAAPVSANMEAAAEMSAFRSASKRAYVPNTRYQTDGKPYLPPKQYQTEGRPAIPNTGPAVSLPNMQQQAAGRDRRIAQPQYHVDAEVFQKGVKTLETKAALGEGVQAGSPMHWVQSCPRHGKYYGRGALTGCPKCVGYIR